MKRNNIELCNNGKSQLPITTLVSSRPGFRGAVPVEWHRVHFLTSSADNLVSCIDRRICLPSKKYYDIKTLSFICSLNTLKEKHDLKPLNYTECS